MAMPDEVLRELLEGYKKPEGLLAPEGLLKQLTAALVGKALSAEMTEHLGYEKNDSAGRGSGDSRNGTSDKTLKIRTLLSSPATPCCNVQPWNPATSL